ncbi:MAG: peroxiredoxin [Myxococcota bacterium]
MLKVGIQAPPFAAKTTQGNELSLDGLRGKYVVMYFFPKAFTPGCTIETKGFQSNYADIAELGAEVIGVSTDRMNTQCQFADKYGVEFPMLADEDGAITRAYEAGRGGLLPFNQRITYIIDPEGKIAAAFDYRLRAHKHIEDALSFMRRAAPAS